MISCHKYVQQNDLFPAWFIASSGPQNGMEEEFLEMILQRNLTFIVCLEPQVRFCKGLLTLNNETFFEYDFTR